MSGVALFAILEQGLKFAVAKEGNKHLDLLKKVQKIKKEYYEELRRTDYSQLALDKLLLELKLYGETFAGLPVPS